MKDDQADGGIFVNYRQRDGDNDLRRHAILVEALSHRLGQHFEERMVFVDTSMSSGTRYPDELRSRLTTCRVLLAVIHPEWIDDLRRRQDTQGPDWVLEEISIALNSHGNSNTRDRTTRSPLVIPILLEKAKLPRSDELPEKIRELADLKSFRLRSGALSEDIVALIKELEARIPPSWQPNSELDSEKSGNTRTTNSLYALLALVTTASIGLQLMITPAGFVATISALMAIFIFALVGLFIFATIAWTLGRQIHRLDKLVARLLTKSRYRSILTLTIGIMTFSTAFLIVRADTGGSFSPSSPAGELGVSLIFIVSSLLLLFMIMAFVARTGREEQEWPPTIPTQRIAGRAGSLRDAVMLLEQRLTWSWRPPLSRVQRDQAQHIIQQLSMAIEILRGEAERSRLEWFRIDYQRVGIAYMIFLATTVGLAATSIFLFIDIGYAGPLLYLAVLTAVLAPGLGLCTVELTLRYQRSQRIRIAKEIEEDLEKRLLPHLPRLRVAIPHGTRATQLAEPAQLS